MANEGQLTKLKAHAYGSQGQLTKLLMYGIDISTGQMTKLKMYGVGAPNSGQLTRLQMHAANPLNVVLTGPPSVEPFEGFLLDGNASTGVYDTATVTQTGGPTVDDLRQVGTAGITWTGTAPAVVPDPADAPILMTFQLALVSGATTVTDTAVVTLYPHTMWRVSGGVLAPIVILNS